jgi:hypothetical protein
MADHTSLFAILPFLLASHQIFAFGHLKSPAVHAYRS